MKTEKSDARPSRVPAHARRGAPVSRRRVRAGPLAGEARADTETNDEKRKARYKETDHVKAYYRVNRYPG